MLNLISLLIPPAIGVNGQYWPPKKSKSPF